MRKWEPLPESGNRTGETVTTGKTMKTTGGITAGMTVDGQVFRGRKRVSAGVTLRIFGSAVEGNVEELARMPRQEMHSRKGS